MDWSSPLDLYCERTDASFWAEPVNALTNLGFLIAALVVFAEWRRAGGRDRPVLALIALTAVIGIGSFIFHTVATRAAALYDTIPIGVFIYAYLLLALRRFLRLPMIGVLALTAVFAAVSYAEARLVPPGTFNGSHAYLPALAAMLLVGWVTPGTAGRVVRLAAGVFAISLAFRTVDAVVCPAFPLGTHFVWHGLNAVVLYLLMRAALTGASNTGAMTTN